MKTPSNLVRKSAWKSQPLNYHQITYQITKQVITYQITKQVLEPLLFYPPVNLYLTRYLIYGQPSSKVLMQEFSTATKF